MTTPTRASRRAEAAVAPTRRGGVSRWLTVALILVGAAVMTYPFAAMWVSASQQMNTAERYVADVQHLYPADRQQAYDAAVAYNDSLAAGSVIVDPFSTAGLEQMQDPADPYWKTLDTDSDGVMARIRIPRIDAILPIYHGTSESTLDKGVGHLEGTALPVGGADTHAVLTGHRGLAEAELFTRLDEMRPGDTIYIDVTGMTLQYVVTRTDVVLPTDTDLLRPVAGKDLITLVTCTPYGVNSHRLLVTAERTTPDPEPAPAKVGTVDAPWWLAVPVAAVLGCGAYLFATRSKRV